MHSRIFQVKDNRIIFRCHQCQTRRSLSIAPAMRSKKIRCHKCGTIGKCIFNRRIQQRQLQSGKALMTLPGGKEIPIELYDISNRGVGCSLAPNEKLTISLHDEVVFSCDWNPKMFSRNSYIIRNIHGRRVGTERKQALSSLHFGQS